MKTPPDRRASIRSYYTGRATLQAQWALDLLDDLAEVEGREGASLTLMFEYGEKIEKLEVENASARAALEQCYGQRDWKAAEEWLEAHPKEL